MECTTSNSSLAITPDKAKAKSVFDTALRRKTFLEKNKVTPENANFIVEGYYSSALEMLHELLLLHGY